MGLNNKNTATNYLTIVGGKISQRVEAETPTSVKRINKNNAEVHEEHYTSLTGIITAIDVETTEWGKRWSIKVTEYGTNYTLQLPYSSGYSNAFLKALPNVDLSQPVTLVPKSKDKKSTLFINQAGKGIKWAYTKANPNGLPQWEQIEVKGQMVWDDSKQLAFLEDMVKGLDFNAPKAPPVLENNDEDQNNDELPF